MNLKLLAIFLVALFAVAVNAEFGEDDVGVGKCQYVCQSITLYSQPSWIMMHSYVPKISNA